MFARLHQRDRHTLPSGPPGAADSVDVLIGIRGHVVVHDMAHVIDVQAARRHVRGHEDVERSVAEAAHHPIPRVLCQPAVEGSCVVAPPAEGQRQIVYLAAGPREHQGRRRVLNVQDPAQCSKLVWTAHDIGCLAHARDSVPGPLFGMNTDPGGFAQVAARDLRNGSRNRCRKEDCLARGRGRRQDRVEVLCKAHVQHLVSFVEHDDPDILEFQRLAREVIYGPPRRRHHDVHAAAESAQLLVDRLTPVHRDDTQADRLAVALEGFGDLHCEFTSRDHDERRRRRAHGPI